MKRLSLFSVLCAMIASAQAQDDCSTAIPVTAGTYTVAAVNGTAPTLECTGGNLATAGEWYVYTPTQNYNLTVTTNLAINGNTDTRLHIYTGTCGSLVCVGGNDDALPTYLSTAEVSVTAGTTYYIAFDNVWTANGFDFQIIENPFVAPVINFVAQNVAVSSTICSVVDMNGDYLDDIVSVTGNGITVLTQKTTGGFNTENHAMSISTTPDWSIAAGDFNRDGFTDLALGNSARLSVLKAQNSGASYTEVTYPQGIFTQRTNFIDINNDGNLDLFACHDVAQSHAYRNDGNGNLNFDISLMPTLAVGGNYQSMWTDYDNDGDQDMYLAKCRGGAPDGDPQRINLLYKNNGDGTFTESGAVAGVNDGAQSWSTAIEDFDNDGDMDFLLSNISDQNRLYKNNGDGTFTDIYSTTGIAAQVGSWELQAADFDNDGWIDFIWQNGKELYLNNGDMTFTGHDLAFSEGGIGDLNNDGFMDIQYGNTAYMNTPNANNWLKVNLQGVQSNRNGIGARVEIYGAWGRQIREIRSGHGFSHQSTLNAHFGLGTASAVTEIRVIWPSGQVDVISNPTINQAVLVVEGAHPSSVQEPTASSFDIFPNPTSDYITVTNSTQTNIRNASVYDLLGKRLIVSKLNNNQINVKDLAAGTYIITLETESGEMLSKKFIKK